MHAGEIVLETHGVSPERDHQPWLQPQRDRAFWMGLAAAFLVHVALVVGISSARERTVGTPDGAADAIAVEIVDGATLKDSMAPPTPPAAPPGMEQPTPALRGTQPDQPPPQPQAEAQPPPEPPPPEPQAQPEPPPPTPEVAEAPPPPPQPEPQETPKTSTQALPELADVAKEEAPQPPDAAKTEEPPAKPPEAKETEAPKVEPKKAEAKKTPPVQKQAKQPPKRRTQTSALDLSMPYDGGSAASDAGSRSAVQRPPGITKSGENDEFARNVIRALQRTMPQERAYGRVTVRIVLSENGSRADVKLLKSGGNPDLDFNVMFAARQTAYPFPPKNATVLDRTFTVTYIYR